MALHVNSLPLELLCAIFCCLSVPDLLLVGRVCSKWHKVRQTVGCKVRKLTLVIGGQVSDDYPEYPNFTIGDGDGRILNDDGSVMYPRIVYPTWNFVHLKWLDLNALIGLTVILPNVTSLEVAIHMSSMYQLCAVTILLRLWQTKLVSFKLHPVLDDPRQYMRRLHRQIPAQISGPLIEAINSLPALKQLSLLFSNTRFGEAQLVLPTLAHLDKFNFGSSDSTDALFGSFRDYAVNNGRVRIRLQFGHNWNAADLNQYYRLGQQMCSQVELINNELHMDRLIELDNLCSNFTSLTALHLNLEYINLAEIPIRNLFSNLAKLTQLLHLGLFNSFELPEREEEEDDQQRHRDRIRLARLPSVKSFLLHGRNISSHDNLSLLDLPLTMPNLQWIRVFITARHYHCDLCGIRNEFVIVEQPLSEQLKTCLSQVMLPLAQCTRLHTISFSTNFENIRLDNLTLDQLSRPLIFE